MYDCVEYTNCKGRGALADFMSIMEKAYNFTLVVSEDENNDWGVVPRNGSTWADEKPILGGVLGATADNRFDMQLSAWNHNYDRNKVVDFTFK